MAWPSREGLAFGVWILLGPCQPRRVGFWGLDSFGACWALEALSGFEVEGFGLQGFGFRASLESFRSRAVLLQAMIIPIWRPAQLAQSSKGFGLSPY